MLLEKCEDEGLTDDDEELDEQLFTSE